MMTCTICDTPVYRNGRGELIHDNLMNVANDHAATLPPERPDFPLSPGWHPYYGWWSL
jgi:hypothetical protein